VTIAAIRQCWSRGMSLSRGRRHEY